MAAAHDKLTKLYALEAIQFDELAANMTKRWLWMWEYAASLSLWQFGHAGNWSARCLHKWLKKQPLNEKENNLPKGPGIYGQSVLNSSFYYNKLDSYTYPENYEWFWTNY